MKPEQQRIKIAKACGWLKITKLDSDLHGWQEQGPLEPLPDYLNDLNAMHEVEKVFNAVQRVQYMEKLGYPHNTSCTFAASAQRAEAFLRTLNLWEE